MSNLLLKVRIGKSIDPKEIKDMNTLLGISNN